MGNHVPLDVEYAKPGWYRDDEQDDLTFDGGELETYTVITCFETQKVKARSALIAESEFDSEDVAAILFGEVENLWSAVDESLVTWSLSRPYRKPAQLLPRQKR